MQEKNVALRFVLGCMSVLLFVASGCETPEIPVTIIKTDSKYLFLSHTRQVGGDNRASIEVKGLDFSAYEALLLGGDLAPFSSRDDATMSHLDSIFDLSSPTTLWALGNHDYSDPSLVQQYTQRPTYYSFHHNHITFVILDTQRDKCNIKDDQLDFLKMVTDTLDLTQQLVVIHHKLIWMLDDPVLEPQLSSVANAGICPQIYCTFRNNFYPDVYPLLAQVRDKGIQVVLIGGDLGSKIPYFSHLQDPDIHFLANGMEDKEEGNKALVLTKNGETNDLTWELVGLNEL